MISDVPRRGPSQEIARAPLPNTATSWTEITQEFTAGKSGAVKISLRRDRCAQNPCPAFGSLWLDDVKITPLDTEE
jgi:hypothetical protein